MDFSRIIGCPENESHEDFKRKAFEILKDSDGGMECQDWIEELIQCSETIDAFGADDPPYVFSTLEDYWDTMDYTDPDTDVCLTYRDWAAYFQHWTHFDMYDNLVQASKTIERLYAYQEALTKFYSKKYYAFSRYGVTLVVAMDEPEPLTEDLVRETISNLIDLSLGRDGDPFSQATNAALRTRYGTEFHMSVEKENLDDAYWKEVLLDNIMESENMNLALLWFKGHTPLAVHGYDITSYELEKRAIDDLTLYDYLIDLVQVEHD